MNFRIIIVKQPTSVRNIIERRNTDTVDLSKVEIKCTCMVETEDYVPREAYIMCCLDDCADAFYKLECFDTSVCLNSILLRKGKNVSEYFFEVNRETKISLLHSLVLVNKRQTVKEVIIPLS